MNGLIRLATRLIHKSPRYYLTKLSTGGLLLPLAV